MTAKEIRDLIEELRNIDEIEEAEWTLAGNTRYEIKHGVDILIFDRYNNIDTDQSECYIKVGNFEKVFPEGTEEYDLISEFVTIL
jgi:hypothetical protein